MWIGEQGISNLLYIHWLERECYSYRIVYDAINEWLVYALDGTEIKFQRDTGLCDRMLYIDIRKFKNVSAML